MSYKRTLHAEFPISTEEPLTPARLREIADQIEQRAAKELGDDPHIYFIEGSEADEVLLFLVGTDWRTAKDYPTTAYSESLARDQRER